MSGALVDYNAGGSGDLDAITAAGAATARDPITGQITLASSTTYYVPIGTDSALVPSMVGLVAMHIQWSAAIVLTVTLESCNFPKYRGGQPATGTATDVSDVDTTAGNWLQEFLSSSAVPVTGGAVASNAITSTPAAGGAMIHIGNLGSRRLRLKLVVGGTGGTVRVNRRGKQAA